MSNDVNVIKLTLHAEVVGHLIGYQNGRNVLIFADEFTNNTQQPTFSLTAHCSGMTFYTREQELDISLFHYS